MERIQIVLASPSDLSEERKMIKDYIATINPLYMKKGFCIDLRMWENSTPGMNADGPQGLIDLDLEIPNADLFICLFWKKYGTIIEPENVSGTEHELNIALENYHKNRKPDIKTYFKQSDLPKTPTEDLEKIQKISERLKSKGLYASFDEMQDLKTQINLILQTEVMKRLEDTSNITPVIRKYIEISSTKELISNLSSNNKLVLNKGFYDILDFEDETDNAKRRTVFDGQELVVKDISDITIVGDNSTLLVTPRYANVINFINCRNIKIIGLTLGHTPRKGSCMGSVLRFENCENIQLESLDLFGCGTYGLDIYNCKNVRTNGVRIFECSYGALHISESTFEFCNSVIFDCNKTADSLISAYNSTIDLSNVSIYNNYNDNYLIRLNESYLFCRGVCIYGNSYMELCNYEIPYGIFVDNNEELSKSSYVCEIFSEGHITKEEYMKIKEDILRFGKINESIYEEGKLEIHAEFATYDLYDHASTVLIEKYKSIDIFA